MQIRPHAPQYLDSLCQLINAADQVDRANLGTSRESLSLLAASTDPEDIQLAFQSDQLVGYARLEWGDAESTRVGCCGIVHPGFRRQGVGTALVQRAMQRAQQVRAGRPFTFFVPVRHSVQGLEQLVTSLHMQPITYFHVLQYGRLPELLPAPQLVPGIEIRSYGGEADIEPMLAAHNSIFARPISRRELDQAVAQSEFAPELWLLAFLERTLVGFCTCAEYGQEAEISYLGVLPEYRRSGLGSSLLALGVRTLAARGHRNIHLAVNVENERALSIYHRAGFVPWRRSTTYALQLNSEEEDGNC